MGRFAHHARAHQRPNARLLTPGAQLVLSTKVSCTSEYVRRHALRGGGHEGGRSASAAVSRVSAASLLIDSGDPIALTASESTNGPTELRELGRPNKIATLLASRRDNDPTGVNVPAFELVTASRDGNELRFELEYPAAEVTSMTKASPKARRVLARSLFVPAEGSLDGVGGVRHRTC